MKLLERAGVAFAGLVLAVVLVSLLSGYFTTRDQASVSGGTGVGFAYVDQGDELLAPGSPHPHYDSAPPTSGPHVPATVRRDGLVLSDDQLLSALAAGNVVILYPGPTPPAALPGVATSLAGRFTPALAASGNAVILGRRDGTKGLLALAWTHLLSIGTARDPLLRQFVDQWLGRGAPHRGGAVPGG